MKISQHALYRYMERVLNFDFTELKILYQVEHGLTSINLIKDAYFLRWCEENSNSFGPFRGAMHNRIWSLMTQTQRNILKNNKSLAENIVDKENKITYVIKEDTVVTVLWNGTKKYD